jgi:hypothetical protein
MLINCELVVLLYHRPSGAVELSSPSSAPVLRLLDRCRFNAGVADAPHGKRSPVYPDRQALLCRRGARKKPSLVRAGITKCRAVSGRRRVFLESWTKRGKRRSGMVLDHPNGPRVTVGRKMLLLDQDIWRVKNRAES